MHWAAKYIGMSYKAGARGPEAVDCWGLVRLVYRNEFYIDLPECPGLTPERPIEAGCAIRDGLAADWMPLEKPFDGCLVAMSRGQAVHHIGLYADVDGGLYVHCCNKANVVAETLQRLRLRSIKLVQYYRHTLWPTSFTRPTP